MQTGSIISSSSARSSIRNKYLVVEISKNEQEAEESSWSDTEDEAEKNSQKDKEGINIISGQNSKIAKVKNSVTLRPGQGAWVHLIEGSWQNFENDFVFPVLFNTIVEKKVICFKIFPMGRSVMLTCNLHD